jgi:hypothetical protein
MQELNPPTGIPFRQYISNYSNKIIGQNGVWLKNDYGIEYFLNSDGLRCDNFKKEHEGEHIVFAGCSNTFGVGTDYEKTWCYQVYDDICKIKNVDGYYNLGLNAGTIIESIFQIFSYIQTYGLPDVIFLFLPEIERDDAFFTYPTKYTKAFVIRIYGMLDELCKQKNVKLISSSWIVNYPGMWESLRQNEVVHGNFPPKLERSKLRDEATMFDDLSKSFKSFEYINSKKFIQDVYDYSLDHKDDPNLYVAKDPGRHFGSAIHHAWKQHFIERYNNEKNN